MKIQLILLLCLSTFFFANCGDKSKTNEGQDFIGIWETYNSKKIRIEIKPLVREGKEIEDRYELVILNKEKNPDLPKDYLQEGQYNYWFVTADPEDNHHPFKEFLYKNTFESRNYLKLQDSDKNILFRRMKGIPDIAFKRIK
ncbi:MAG: hypothetical protein AB8G11_02625 [Saprospiraceae bacterium]